MDLVHAMATNDDNMKEGLKRTKILKPKNRKKTTITMPKSTHKLMKISQKMLKSMKSKKMKKMTMKTTMKMPIQSKKMIIIMKIMISKNTMKNYFTGK
jgi:hypothetical protein